MLDEATRSGLADDEVSNLQVQIIARMNAFNQRLFRSERIESPNWILVLTRARFPGPRWALFLTVLGYYRLLTADYVVRVRSVLVTP